MKRIIISVVLAAISANISFAQGSYMLSTRDGLCSSDFQSMFIDTDGNLWIGTGNGLNRYDGFNVSSYYSNQTNESSPINDVIHTFSEDDDRNVIIGTLSGLCSYSLETKTFSNIAFRNREHPNISSIIKLHDGTLLASTRGYSGLYSINKDEDGEFMASPKVWTDEPDIYNISAVYEDVNSNIWIWAAGKGIFRMSGDSLATKVMDTPEDNEEYGFASFCEDSFDAVYMAGWKTGLIMKKDGSDKLVQVLPAELEDLRITSLEYHEGLVYICTYGSGVYTYNINDGTVDKLHQEFIREVFDRSQVRDILFDKDGNTLTAIAHEGVLIAPARSSSLLNTAENNSGFSCKSPVRTMFINRDNNIWVGTESDGLFLIDNNFRVLKHIVTDYAVLSVYEDRTGTLWFGQGGSGLYMVKPGQRAAEAFPLKDEQGQEMYNVNQILEDNRGTLWVFCSGYGMASINNDRTKVTRLATGDDHPDQRQTGDLLENSLINCAKIIRGRIYIGTYNGLSCYNIRTGSFLSNFPDRNHILSSRIVKDIEEDSDHDLWLATTTGLVHVNHETFNSERYTFRDGLPQNNISSVAEDSFGRIWVSTSDGLACLDRNTNQFTSILTPRGSSNEFCGNSDAFLEDDGLMMFGNQNGIAWFNPGMLNNTAQTSDIFVSDFYTADEHYMNRLKADGRIKLDHGVNGFSIELSTGSFSENSLASFSYKMGDGEIEYLPRRLNRITFNKLKPGKYNITIFCNSPGKTYNDLDLEVRIKHAWYASSLATVMYILALLAALFYAFRKQNNRFTKKEQMQKDLHELELNEAKLQYFFNLAHEIRMPMSLIISPLSKLIATDKNPERQVQYGMMANNARRINLLINQIMDIRKIEKGKLALSFSETDINKYLQPLIDVMEQSARQKGISLTCDFAKDNPEVWIDIRQFDKVVLNILQNAIKYTPEGGNVHLSVSTAAKELVIKVRDNGIGLDEDKTEQIFERFYQADKADAEMGFGIGLNLVKSLVNMHHGSVKAYNNSDSPGATFEIRIPLGRKHLEDTEIATDTGVSDYISTSLSLYETDDEGSETEDNRTLKSRYNIAIVEDNHSIRQYLINELSQAYNVTAYENGLDAYNGILKASPDLVISDVVIPGMDGFQLCDKLKKNINTNAVPIILLTGKTEETDRIAGLEAGADAYITKPFNIVLLKKNIEQLLGNINRLKNIYIGRQTTKVDTVPDVKNSDEMLLARINKALNANISNPEFDVEFLANEVGLSRVHLYRKLMELTNQGPGDFIRNARLNMAAELLKEKHLDVSTVAVKTGFSSISIFSRAFKHLYGVSPSEYASKK